MTDLITSASKAPPTAVQQMRDFLDGRRGRLAEWAAKGTDPATLIRFALFDYAQNEQLQKCSPESIYLALIACAQAGLEPGPLKGEAWIVPYKDRATFQLGWRGMVALARRSGVVRSIKANVVHRHDHFEIDLGSDERVVHRPALGDRGEVIGAYALAKMESGEIEVEWMNRDDLERVQRAGSGTSPAYRDWADQMQRKAPIRRLAKRLPLGEQAARAFQADAAAEGGDFKGYRNAIDVESADVDDAAQAPAEAMTAAEKRATQVGRGTEAVKRQVAARKAKAEAAPAPERQTATFPVDESDPRLALFKEPARPASEGDDDELADNVRSLLSEFDTIIANPGKLPDLRAGIGKLPPGDARTQLEAMLARAERQIQAARS